MKNRIVKVRNGEAFCPDHHPGPIALEECLNCRAYVELIQGNPHSHVRCEKDLLSFWDGHRDRR